MKTILGLDIGTNSIGGALIKLDLENYGSKGQIKWLGSRIVPVDGDYLQKFETGGQVESKAAARRQKRMSRKLKHRYKLRRTRLVKVFKVLDWIDQNFPEDFKKMMKEDPSFNFNIGTYLPFQEETIIETLRELLGNKQTQEILEKGNGKIPLKESGRLDIPISEDWVIYYLRKKGLFEKISLQELARIIYIFNQRRGFKSSRKDLKDTTILDYDDFRKMVDAGVYIDENGNILETQFVEITKIKAVEQLEQESDKNGKFSFKIIPESNRIRDWEEKRKKKPEWEGKEYKFLVTQKTKKKGEVEQLKPQIPADKDWSLAMVALDNEFKDKHPGEFFFDKLKENKNYRIRQQVVKRIRYQEELRAIWNKQTEFYPELTHKNKLEEIARVLYPIQSENKLAKWKEIINGTLYNVIANDIIYYQRDLKSQKNLIDECRYEKKVPYKGKDGQEIVTGYKVAPKSCPEFQEFRIWQDIHNLKIIEKEKEINGKIHLDVNVTSEYIDIEKKAELFDLFDDKHELKEKDILKYLNINTKMGICKINLYANRESLKGNETKSLIRTVFNKYGFNGENLLNDKNKFRLLWHILYSLNGKDHEKAIKNALKNPKNSLFFSNGELINHFANKTKELPKQYASFSLKSINKLLPLMRCGKYWNENNINPEVKKRIYKFIDGEYDEHIDENTREKIKLFELDKVEKFQGLPVWLACYVVYGRHSERENNSKYEKPTDIDVMQLVPTNSLRNPIVEKIIRETLNIVKDIWGKYERPDYIHIEMARELKHTLEERKKISDAQNKNFDEKQRAKKLLHELKIGNPESLVDLNKFRIWLNNGGKEGAEKFNRLFDNKGNVSRNEIQRYLLWAKQGHKSPYTGAQIPLSKLFTDEYEIEHIIPQSKMKYDAFQNLIICERVVNGFKDNRLARVMIEQDGGREHEYKGQKFYLSSFEEYKTHCTATFKGKKLNNLFTTEIPDDFIERQINDTRHITRKLNELLWPVAKEKEGLVFTIGSITNDLKKQWGFNNVWKELLKPRFERLEEILNQRLIIPDENDENKYSYNLPNDKIQLKKRIDHRHHAMDALIVATTTRAHIKYLNSLHSHEGREKWKYLAKKGVRDFIIPWPEFTKDAKEELQKVIISYKACNRIINTPKNRYQKWEQQSDGNWKKVLIKQKPNERWKAVKKSMFKEPSGIIYLKEIKEVPVNKAIKIQLEREKGIKDETGKPRNYIYDQGLRKLIKKLCIDYQGNIKLISKEVKKLKYNKENSITEVNVAVFDEYAAKRVSIDKSFTEKKIKDSLPYAKRIIKRWEEWQKTGVNKKGESFPINTEKWPIPFLLLKHLQEFKDNSGKVLPNEAFQGEGKELLQKKAGKPINKLTIYEKKSNPIRIGGKILETDKGSNVYFVIYKNLQTGVREEMYSVPLFSTENVNDPKDYGAINRLLNNMPIADDKPGYKTFILKPNELVYVPTPEEQENPNLINQIDWNGKDREKLFERIYKMVSCTSSKCLFVPHNIAQSLENSGAELGSGNKNERAWDGKVEYKINKKGKESREDTGSMIKQSCIPIKLDRLGNVEEIDGKKIIN